MGTYFVYNKLLVSVDLLRYDSGLLSFGVENILILQNAQLPGWWMCKVQELDIHIHLGVRK